jgi:hypothetical protein
MHFFAPTLLVLALAYSEELLDELGELLEHWRAPWCA